MQVGYVGLGKMGFNMSLRLLEKGYDVVANDKKEEPIKKISERGAEPAYSLKELSDKLPSPRLIWVMVPHQVASDIVRQLSKHLEEGDIIIDGGNTFYKDSLKNAEELEEKGIHFMDVGVSGGPSGARNGASMMIGGEKEIFDKYEELFDDLTVEGGYGYMGKAGAGHFVKMIHNGIEYGMMQAIAEGFDILKESQFNLNLEDVAEVYSHGTVIESRLIGWMKSAFKEYGQELESVSGEAGESGEGRWTVKRAHEMGIPDNVIHSALEARETSRMVEGSYQGKIINALRNQFGGHSTEDPEVST